MSKSASSSFPLELTTEILLRLPPESVARSRYVSKLWSSITTDPYFTNKFETRSSTRPSLLMFFKNKDKLFVFSFPHHNKNSNEPRSFSQHVDCYHMKYPKDCSFPFAESVHGLICFRTSVNRPIIWNPSMRQFIKLTKPGKRWKDIKVFLGYDPIEGKHKVVCMRRGYKVSGEYCRVLTLGSAQQSWRTVKTNHKHFAYIDCYARCINGVLYFEALLDDDSDVNIIMSFDVRTEKFDMIKLPLHDFWGMMISYEGRLAYLDYYNPMDNGGIKLWILEDKEKHRWSCKHFVTPFGPRLETSYKIDGVTDAGEFILVPLTFLKSFFILYFDPVRNSLRRVEFKGIADENFRFRNGLGNKRLRALYTIPNHVESLVSF